jgi:small GTP-binding protein
MRAEEVFHARVVVIGDSSVGKTSILNRLVEDTFNEFQLPTIGSNFQLFGEEVDGARVELQIWDTAGQEKFRSLGPIYFRNAVAALAVYDQGSQASFQHLEKWIKDFTDVAGEGATIAIAGNKVDLVDSCEVVYKDAEMWANEQKYLIGQTSALTGYGVRSLFSALAYAIRQNAGPRQESLGKGLSDRDGKKCKC